MRIGLPQSSDIVASMVIPLLVTSIAAPASGPVFLDAGTLTSSLAAALEAEGCAVEAAREDADTWVTAELGGDGLALRVVTAEGRLLLERALSVGPGLGAALRTSALLVEEALSAERAVEATRRPAWTLSAAARVSLWLDPATPSTGFAIAAHVPLGPVRAGARASVDGLACCTITRPSAVSASSFATALALELSLPIAGAGRVELSADAALGAGLRRVTSTVESFAAPAPDERHSAFEGLARAAIGAHLRVTRGVALVAVLGAEARFARLRVEVPPPYPGSEEALDPGLVAPFAELGVTSVFF